MVDVHEELREHVASGAVTVIVGAGVSIQASGGAPCASWQGLLLDGADEARFDPDFRERYAVVKQEIHSNHPDDFISAARKISRTLGAPNGGRYRSWLRRTIGQLPLVDHSIIDAIHGLGATIATTNYDGLLSRARDAMSPVCWSEPSRVERVLRRDEPGILHLHGYWEQPDSVILDASSYDQIVVDEHAQAVMRTLRLTSTLVFVGCGAGLQDPNFEQFRAWLARAMRSSEYASYRLAIDSEADGLQRLHRDAKDGVRVIGYGAKHGDLAPYLRSLVPATAVTTPASTTVIARLRGSTSSGEPPAPAPARPVPVYADAEVEALSKRLEDARARRAKLLGAGLDAQHVDREILELRRQIREGGRLRAGDSLGDGRYLLVRTVGQGGFAVVWEAYDCAEQRRVAIKLLHTNLGGDSLRRKRFFRGAHAMMRLAHPAVVRVLEPEGEDGGFYYFVMELISGGNLREAVLEGRWKAEDTLPLILRIGEALALAHSRGMIHRDIKPANILLDERGNAKLTDFDLVGAHDTTGGTRTGALGTVVYAAPECLEKPQEATARADVYSLGMTALFSLSGRELSLSTFRNPELTISTLGCSAHIRAVLGRSVAWEPRDRFADAAAMVAALRAAIDLPSATDGGDEDARTRAVAVSNAGRDLVLMVRPSSPPSLDEGSEVIAHAGSPHAASQVEADDLAGDVNRADSPSHARVESSPLATPPLSVLPDEAALHKIRQILASPETHHLEPELAPPPTTTGDPELGDLGRFQKPVRARRRAFIILAACSLVAAVASVGVFGSSRFGTRSEPAPARAAAGSDALPLSPSRLDALPPAASPPDAPPDAPTHDIPAAVPAQGKIALESPAPLGVKTDLPAKIATIKHAGDVVQYGDTIAVLIEARSADDDVGLDWFSVEPDNTTTAPQASTPVIAKIVSTSAQERDTIISMGAGASSGIDLDWEASLLGRNGDERMVNSKIQVVRVDETITVGMMRNVDAQAISANSRVKLSAPRCKSPRVLCGGACVDINRNANHCGHCDSKCPSGICSLRSCMSRVELPAPGGGTMLPMVKTGDVVPAGAVVARIQHKAIPTATFNVDDASSLSPKARASIRIEGTGQSITCTLVKIQINLIKVACPDNAALAEGALVTYVPAR